MKTSSIPKEKSRIQEISKKRRITITQGSDHGIIFTNKNKEDGLVEFESILEGKAFSQFIQDPNCTKIESQPLKIPNPNGRFYTPDIYAKFIDETEYIYDVKYQEELDRIKEDPEEEKKYHQRLKTVIAYCEEHGFKYEIITDNEIETIRFENINFFEMYAEPPELLPKIKPVITETLT